MALKCLRLLLAAESRTVSTVNILEWGRLIARFGSLRRASSAAAGGGGGVGGGAADTLLERVYDMLSRKWFHGGISKEETSIRLKNATPGTYVFTIFYFFFIFFLKKSSLLYCFSQT